MGDRTDVHLSLHGKISQVEAEELLELLQDYGFRDDDWKDLEHVGQMTDRMHADEVNYGDIDQVVEYCLNHGIAYDYWHGRGGGYDSWAYRFDGEKSASAATNDDDGPSVALSEILRLENAVTGWAGLIALARFFAKDLPPLEIVP